MGTKYMFLTIREFADIIIHNKSALQSAAVDGKASHVMQPKPEALKLYTKGLMQMNLKEQAIEKMKDIFGTDEKRIKHALKVLNYAEQILSGENMTGREEEIVILTAVLHDIGIQEAERKYNSNSGRYQEIEGPPIAKAILESLGLDREITERVCYIIGGHHTWSKNNGKDFQIIWEADMLVNIQDDGIECFGPNLKSVIDKNYKTPTGKKLAQETLNI